ncbi:defender against death DAD protein [Neocallimastix lanati (nom. inval.)]|jgi:oligosaccharyltransferase complex subunit epsilon|nr:defender against death DAD protein [Neocallimastix sp. JGI-2020a]
MSTKPGNTSAKNIPVKKEKGDIQILWENYLKNTPGRYKILDAYMSFVVMMGVIQFVYCFIIGKEPWATFLAGFISCVGTFVLVANLRIQSNPNNMKEFPKITPERSYADFFICSIILYLFVISFIG